MNKLEKPYEEIRPSSLSQFYSWQTSRHTIATFASRKRFRKRESRYRARQHDVDSGRHAERLKQIPTLGRKNPPLDCSTITTAYNDTPERAEIVDVTANDTAE